MTTSINLRKFCAGPPENLEQAEHELEIAQGDDPNEAMRDAMILGSINLPVRN